MRLAIPTLTLAVGLTLSATVGAAEQSATAEATKEGDRIDKEAFTLATATCGDLYDLYRDATPGEGKDPQDVQDAQDDLLFFIVWAHGYLSGKHGLDLEKRPLGRVGIERLVAELDAVCRADTSRRFLEVVPDID